MGPRKRSRPNPQVEATVKATSSKQSDDTDKTKTVALPTPSPPSNGAAKLRGCILEAPEDVSSDARPLNQSHPSRGWYIGGTWPRMRKSTPSTQVAREAILAGTSRNTHPSSNITKFESCHPPSSESLPVTRDSPTTGVKGKLGDVHSSSGAARPPAMLLGKSRETVDMTLPDMSPSDAGNIEITPAVQKRGDEAEGSAGRGDTSAPTPELPDATCGHPTPIADEVRPIAASGWLGWFGMSNAVQISQTERSSTLLPSDNVLATLELGRTPKGQVICPSTSGEFDQITTPILGGSWLSLWTSSTTSKPKTDTVPSRQSICTLDNPSLDSETQNNPTAPAPGSTWAFWSRDSGKAVDESGELAIAGETSQNHPSPVHTTTTQTPEAAKIAVEKQRKKERSFSSLDKVSQAESSRPTPISQTTASPKPFPNNLLLPSFRGTYRLVESTSIIQQIARLLTQSRQPQARHVRLLKDPPKIKNAIAIGIHGLFPAALLRTVIGQPTGTSIRFASHAAAAIHRWADENGSECEIEKIALEGEGKIAERVDNLWKLLLNWIEHVRCADFILVACHSQGVPVAIMLVAKLIEFGVVTTAKIGVCAMAGVSLGPFADYKSRLLSGSAAELFDFATPESDVSKRQAYEHALRVVLKYGVRIAYTGSIDDQLVSLESAIFSPANHPYIYRSVFVDGRVHAPDFIAHLVGFTLKLRNIGVSDHGIIRELSAPLAGSLYSGEGHSRLYDEAKVYDVAVEFALETASVGDIPLQMNKYVVPTNTNPFQLPWSMRGLLEEDIVKTDLNEEVKELLEQFDDWKPSTKVLKDVKYRLEAVKSKL